MVSSTWRMSADTSPAERPYTLALIATSRLRLRRLIWFGPVDSTTCATWPRRTTRAVPSAALPTTKGSCSRSLVRARCSGARRTFTS